ncbi:MAG TPA: prolipoprotein diacylglyceryl transferase [Sporichthyaceae bacterium]|jgi:prolipoprotein diacylglyceryl transferase
MVLASIPSPSQGVWHLGPFPIRGYALCIVVGIIVAIAVGEKRFVARGGTPGQVTDIAFWAVPFGIVGGRLYHVITTPEPYFGHHGDPGKALEIWKGGLGIWGAVALGGLGAWIGCKRMGVRLAPLADAVCPGVALAQACGRWGNWFNQELYGRPSHLPWALRIDPAHRPDNTPDIATYHPTFLYESLWCLGVAAVVLWADRRYNLGHGQTFWLYVATYTVGRGWIEALRVDTAEHVLGLRLNDWTSIVVFSFAVSYIVWSRRHHPARELSVYRDGHVLVSAAPPEVGEPERAEP